MLAICRKNRGGRRCSFLGSVDRYTQCMFTPNPSHDAVVGPAVSNSIAIEFFVHGGGWLLGQGTRQGSMGIDGLSSVSNCLCDPRQQQRQIYRPSRGDDVLVSARSSCELPVVLKEELTDSHLSKNILTRRPPRGVAPVSVTAHIICHHRRVGCIPRS